MKRRAFINSCVALGLFGIFGRRRHESGGPVQKTAAQKVDGPAQKNAAQKAPAAAQKGSVRAARRGSCGLFGRRCG